MSKPTESELRHAFIEHLTADVHHPDGWLSDAQNANLEVLDAYAVGFLGEGSIDVQQIASELAGIAATLFAAAKP